MELYKVSASFKISKSPYRRNRVLNVQASGVIEACNKAVDYIYGLDEKGACEINVWSVNHIGRIDIP